MNERMMETVYEALKDVDVVVHLVDASERFGRVSSTCWTS